MSTLIIIFIVLAILNIGINAVQMFDPDNDNKTANFSAICGWFCAILYALP